jgi:ribonuclease P protein component
LTRDGRDTPQAPLPSIRPEMSREEDVPTEQARAQAPPRLSRAHGDQGRPQGHRRPPRAWPQAPVSLIDRRLPVRGARARQIGRLTKRPDFVAAASGRRFRTERMTVQGRLRERDDLGLRLGLTVTKKVGHATERNRIKRRLRTAAAAAAAGHAKTDIDVVVIGRRDILTADYQILMEDLRRALAVVTRPKGARSGKISTSSDGESREISHA